MVFIHSFSSRQKDCMSRFEPYRFSGGSHDHQVEQPAYTGGGDYNP